MRYKKIVILTIILAFLLAISAVSAQNNVTNDIVSVKETTFEDVCVSVSNVNNGGHIVDNSLMLNSVDNLNNYTATGVNILSKNYASGSNIWESSITIDGQGRMLDGENSHRSGYEIFGKNVTIKNFIFINGYAENTYAGALSIRNDNCTIINCTFINNYATSSGGALHLEHSNQKIINCTFINNNALRNDGVSNGGAIGGYDSAENCSIINCTFINNNGHYAGAISFSGPNIIINNCIFLNNSATRNRGGAIELYRSSGGTIINCYFNNNHAKERGDDIFWQLKDGFIINCYSDNNDGICIAEGANATIIKCSLLLKCSNLTINYPNQFYFANLTWNGFPVVNKTIQLKISNGDEKYIFNVLTDTGGIVKISDFLPNLTEGIWTINVIFEEDKCSYSCNQTFNINLNNSLRTFNALSKVIENTPAGGTLNLIHDYVYVSDSTNGIIISKPITINGQGHSIDGKNLSRIFNITSNNVILNNINFIGGYTITNGGAIYWQGDNGEINNCCFKNNTAFEGGAIYLNNSNNYNLFSCNFINNKASIGGGAIYSTDSQFNIDYCNFNNNYATYEICGGADNNVKIKFYIESVERSFLFKSPMDILNVEVSSKYKYYNYKWNLGPFSSEYIENRKLKVIGLDITADYFSDMEYPFKLTLLNSSGYEEIIEVCYKGGYSVYATNSTANINNTFFNTRRDLNYVNFYDENTTVNRNNVFNFTGLNLIKKSINLEFNDMEFDSANASALSAILKDEYGNPIPNHILVFKITNPNGQYQEMFTGTTDKNGYFSTIYNNNLSKDDLNNLVAGNWTVEVIFGENDNYYGCNKIGNLLVNKKKTSVFMENVSTSIGKKISVVANVSGLNYPNFMGTYYDFNLYMDDLVVDFYIDDEFINSFSISDNFDKFFENKDKFSQYSFLVNGTSILNYTPNSSGYHTIHAIFNGNNYFEGSEFYATLFVDEISMNLSVDDTIRNSNTQFVVTVSNLLNETINEGYVTFYDGYFTKREYVINNTAAINYVPTVAGNHTVRAVYSGNQKFNDVEKIAIYYVDKVGTKLIVENNSAIVFDNANIIIDVIADNNETVHGGVVYFYFNDNYMGYAPVYGGLAIIPIEYFSTGFFLYSTNDDVIVSSGSLWDEYLANPASHSVEYMGNIKTHMMNYTIGKNIIRAIYSNSNDFANSGNISNFTINKAKSDIYIESYCHDWDCMITAWPVVSDDVYLKGNITNEGTVRFYVDGKYVGGSPIEDWHATLNHMFSRAGNHSIYVEYCESDYFLSSNNTTEISLEWTNVEINHQDISGFVMSNITFTVNVTNDYSTVYEGIISLYYDNDYFDNFTVVNGTAELNFIPQTIGNHIIKLKYSGSENFHTNEVEFNIQINKLPTSIILENVTGIYSFENTFVANVKSLDHVINEGIVLFYINGNCIGYCPVVNGTAYLSYIPSNAGNYNVKAIFENSTNFLNDEEEVEYIVNPLNSTLTLDEVYTTLGHDTTIIAHINSENIVNEGTVTFYHGNDSIGESQVVNGTAIFTFVPMDYMPDWTSNLIYVPNFTYGNDTIYAIFNGYNHRSSKGTANILIDKATMKVSVITNPVGFNTTFLVNITKLFGIVDTGNVNFYLSTNYGNYIGYVPIKNGTASFNYVPLNAGNHDLNVLWSSGIFDAGELLNFTIEKANSKLNIYDLNGTVGGEVILTATVSSSNNLTINEGYIDFFDGETNIGKSNVTNGVATLTYTPTNAGEHPITARFYADNYGNNINFALLNVSKASVDLSIDNILDVDFKEPSKFTVHVTSDSNMINEGEIKFYVNDSLIGSSDIYDGVANFEYAANGGSSILTVVYEENDNYLASSQTANFVVNAIPSTLFVNDITAYYNDGSYLLVKLVDSSGVPISGVDVLVYLDGVKTLVTDNDGQIRVSINGLAPKTYVTKVAFGGNANYAETNTFVNVVIHKAPSCTVIDDLNGIVGHELKITVTVVNYVNNLTINDGKVVFFDGETNIGESNVVNGSAILTYIPLYAGSHNVKAVYCDSIYFTDSEKTASLTVDKADSKILINNTEGTVDHEVSLTVNVVSSNNLTIDDGKVVFFDGETNIGEANVANGMATLIYAPTTAGNHSITAWYHSNNYQDAISSALLTVAKANIDLTISKIDSVYFTNPSNFIVNINSNSKPVNEGKIKYYVNNEYIGIADVFNGNSKSNYITNGTGFFTLTVVYDESENYLSANTISYFEVNRMPTTLTGESVIFDEEALKTFTTELKDTNNLGVNGKPVRIEVIKYSGESATFNGISDANGITIYDVGRLAGGMWYVTGIYAGDENYIDSRFADKFIVVRIATTTVIEEIENPKVNHTYKLKANIHDENGKLVKDGILQFYLDGVDIGSIDLSKNQGHQNALSNGVLGAINPIFAYELGDDDEASDLFIEYIPTKAGKHTLTAVYEGTTIYKSSNQTTTFIVSEESNVEPEIIIPPLDEPSADGSVAINLPNDATGTVTLTVDGKNYTFDVKNGVANVKLPDLGDGNYDYTITYSGDSKYSSFKTNGNMKVNNTKPEDTKPTPEIVIPPLDEPSNEGSVKVTLPSDATGKVTLSINGKEYTYLVENGVANVIIPNLGEGDYPYTITYSGDSKYSSFTTNGSLNKPAPKVDPKITAKNTAVQYSAKGKYSVTVYGTDGKVASGVQVIFKISGKQVGKAKTNTKGVASYVVTKNPGKYKIQATALGKSLTKTVTVKHIVTLKTVTLKKSAKKLTLQATLAKVNGKYLKKKTIIFKINGKKVATAKTNSKGVAKITIKNPSVVKKLKVGKKVTYQATYLKDTVKKTAKIKK